MKSIHLFLLAILSPSPARAEWLRANFHGHTRDTLLRDDGSETPLELHSALKHAGFDFSVHSVHSTHNTSEASPELWRMEKQHEDALDLGSLSTTLGEELTVAPGPKYQNQTRILGQKGPSNLDHMTLFGIKSFVPSKTPLAEACDHAHADGGVCLVNHPGPGPLMWEEGLWESPANRGKIDGIEVYNGEAMALLGWDFERRYLQATSFTGLGLRIAAVTGTDTHGPESFSRSRKQLANSGAASKLLSLVLPDPRSARPELDAATLVSAKGHGEKEVIDAVKSRRTIATWALPHLRVECDHLGEVQTDRNVDLQFTLSRPVAEITLYKEGVAVKTWTHASEASWKEKLDRPAAYVFGVRDGSGRLLTSAIWYK
jgi:hypothetical protein